MDRRRANKSPARSVVTPHLPNSKATLSISFSSLPSTPKSPPVSSMSMNDPSRSSGDSLSYSLFPDDPSTLLPLHHQILSSIVPSFIPSYYLFQHSPFHLTAVPNSPTPHLHGVSRFGDNLDDEWLLTSLLLHISSLIPNLSVQLHDSDGDFLLIEAAIHLPRWLRPDNSLNRVFLRGGALHIIPLKPYPHPLSLPSALSILRSHPEQTIASDPIQSATKNKLAAYPAKAIKNMHRVNLRVPVAVAQVLKHEPCLVALAVEEFYDRDVDSMKYAARMEKFGGKEEGEMVRVSVGMTRAMYGQLVQQGFQAPKGYWMPREIASEGFREAEIGMKLACGFEMMYWTRRREGEEGRGGTWEVFFKSLERSGLFDGLLPGSEEYRKKMDWAMEYYKNTTLALRTRYWL